MQRQWTPIKEYSDILFEYFEGIAKITINRPQVRNAFTPTTVAQMSEALVICRQRNDIRVVVLTGAGDKAFCSGGDMHVKGIGGYIDPQVCRGSMCSTCKNKSVLSPNPSSPW